MVMSKGQSNCKSTLLLTPQINGLRMFTCKYDTNSMQDFTFSSLDNTSFPAFPDRAKGGSLEEHQHPSSSQSNHSMASTSWRHILPFHFFHTHLLIESYLEDIPGTCWIFLRHHLYFLACDWIFLLYVFWWLKTWLIWVHSFKWQYPCLFGCEARMTAHISLEVTMVDKRIMISSIITC